MLKLDDPRARATAAVAVTELRNDATDSARCMLSAKEQSEYCAPIAEECRRLQRQIVEADEAALARVDAMVKRIPARAYCLVGIMVAVRTHARTLFEACGWQPPLAGFYNCGNTVGLQDLINQSVEQWQVENGDKIVIAPPLKAVA